MKAKQKDNSLLEFSTIIISNIENYLLKNKITGKIEELKQSSTPNGITLNGIYYNLLEEHVTNIQRILNEGYSIKAFNNTISKKDHYDVDNLLLHITSSIAKLAVISDIVYKKNVMEEGAIVQKTSFLTVRKNINLGILIINDFVKITKEITKNDSIVSEVLTYPFLSKLIKEALTQILYENIMDSIKPTGLQLFSNSFITLSLFIGSQITSYFLISMKPLTEKTAEVLLNLEAPNDLVNFFESNSKKITYSWDQLCNETLFVIKNSLLLGFLEKQEKIWQRQKLTRISSLTKKLSVKNFYYEKQNGELLTYENLKMKITQMNVNIGSLILNQLIEDKILETYMDKRAKFVSLNPKFELNIVASARFYRPPISKKPFDDKATLFKNEFNQNIYQNFNIENITINVKNPSAQIHKNSDFTLDLGKELQEALNARSIKYKINEPLFEDFMAYFNKTILLNPLVLLTQNIDSAEVEPILNFMTSIYQIELKNIISSIKIHDKALRNLFKKILLYAFNFGTNKGSISIKQLFKTLENKFKFNNSRKKNKFIGIIDRGKTRILLLKLETSLRKKKKKFSFTRPKLLYHKKVGLLYYSNSNIESKYVIRKKIGWVWVQPKARKPRKHPLTFFYYFLNKRKVTRHTIKKNLFRALKKYYEIIVHYKASFYDGLNEINIYKIFDHFFIPSFISYSGRVYAKGLLHQQGHYFLRSFIAYAATTDIINLEKFKKYKEIVYEFISTETLKQKVESLTYDEYLKEKEDLEWAQILSNVTCDKRFIVENIKKTFNFSECLQLLLPKIKKPKTILITLSLIKQKINPNNDIECGYQLDASSSGYQMMAMMLKNKKLGEMSNLIGSTQYDIYLHCISNFNLVLENLDLFMENLFKITDFSNHNNLKESIKQFIFFFTNYRLSSELRFDKYDIQAIFIRIMTKIKENKINFKNLKEVDDSALDSHDWIINTLFPGKLVKSLVRFLKLKTNHEAWLKFAKLLILSLFYPIRKQIINDNLWVNEFIRNREITKRMLMASPYLMTPFGSVRAIKKAFYSKAFSTGIFNINDNSLFLLCKLIEGYFTNNYKLKYLLDSDKFTSIIKQLTNITEITTIKNKFMTWAFDPHIRKIYRLNVKDIKNKRVYQPSFSYRTSLFDKKKFLQAFIAVYIHSMDASIVHDVMIESLKLNKKFKRLGLAFYITTIHDCFISNMSNAPFLKLIINEFYNRFNSTTSLENIKHIYENVSDLIEKPENSNFLGYEITNPNFIKF